MARMLNVRLDPESEALLKRLNKYWGSNTSQIVREALKALAALTPQRVSDRIVGIGEFSSGKSDLGSNKQHLEGFGK